MPESCACGQNYNVTHALTCKVGGFVTIRHNEVRDLTAKLLQEVCHSVQIEPPLEPLTGEKFKLKSTNTTEEARLGIAATGLFEKYRKAFLDIRVINPLAKTYSSCSVEQALKQNEREKKRS